MELTDNQRAAVRGQIQDVEANRDELRAEAREMVAENERRSAPLKQIARELKAERERQGLSLAELRDRCGIERGALSRLESGQTNPTVTTLMRVAEALGMEIVVELRKAA